MTSVSISSPADNSTVTLTGGKLPFAAISVEGYDYSSIEEAYAKIYHSSATPPLTPPLNATAGMPESSDSVMFSSLECPVSNNSDTYKIVVWVTTDTATDLMDVNTFTGNT